LQAKSPDNPPDKPAIARIRDLRSDRGSVTAEFAVVLPAVLAVLLLALGALLLAAQQISLSATAFEVARLEARGDGAAAEQRLDASPLPLTVSRNQRGALHCVTLYSSPAAGVLAVVRLESTACAATSTQ